MRTALTLFCLGSSLGWATPNQPGEKLLRSLPITFERNQGQWSREVEFGAHIGGHEYTFNSKEIVIDRGVRLNFGNSLTGKLEPMNPAITKTNYLVGADSRAWLTGVPNYGRLRRRNAFPGIDLIFYGSHGHLEVDYLVAPGANPDRIHVQIHGAVVETDAGSLKLRTSMGEVLEFRAPVAFQEDRTGRRSVDCRFKVRSRSDFGLATGRYDRASMLTIDPILVNLEPIPGTYLSPSGNYPVVLGSNGHLYLAGSAIANIPNIPVTPGTLRPTSPCQPFSPSAPVCIDNWAMEFAPNENQVIWATYFGAPPTTVITTMALDASGNLVLGGNVNSPNFPVTSDAYLSTPPKTNNPDGVGFISKLNPSGTSLVYSTFLEHIPWKIKLDSSGAVYFTDGAVVQKFRANSAGPLYTIQLPGGVYRITVDDAGNLYALSGRSPGFTVTPGAYKSSDSDPLIISKFDGQANLAFAASFNAPVPFESHGIDDRGSDIEIDGNGSIVFTGMAGSGFPTTNDPDPQTDDCDPTTPCMAYVAALDKSGSVLSYARLLGHGRGDRVAFGSSGDVWVGGDAYGGYFPRTFDAFQYCNDTPPSEPTSGNQSVSAPNGFVMRLDSQGQRKFSSFLGTGETVVSYVHLTADGTLYVGGFGSGSISFKGYFAVIVDTTQMPRTPHACLVNATQNGVDSDLHYDYIAPGQIVTLFGEGLGPQAPASAQWNDNGTLANSLAGVQVLFNGIPAPLLYAQANQVNCIVPFGIAGAQTATVVAQYAGSQTDPLVLHVHQAVANPLTKDYLTGSDLIAVNEDGTMNSANHPALRGSIVTVYATGLGQTVPALQDGQIAPGAAPATGGISIQFFDNTQYQSLDPAQILYQGAAPGQVAGIYQINVRVPANAGPGHALVQFVSVGFATQRIWLK